MIETRNDDMDVQIIPATSEDRPTLRNLLQLYLHDFSEVLPRAPDRDGTFPYPHLDAYWIDDWRKPFLITADGEVAGFAFVRTQSVVTGADGIADMAEFFVVRGLRRHGVGRAAARLLFARFPGTWEVRVIEHYAAARAFWVAAIEQAAQSPPEQSNWVNEHGVRFEVFRFDTARAEQWRGTPHARTT
jgi:predicted acetyltransferase